jgi:hypothetical protein
MDTLEVFEHAQTLRKDQVTFCITRLHVPVFPIKVNADLPRLPQHFQPISRSAVFFLEDNIVLKIQTQDLIADVDLPSEQLLLDLSLGNFVFRDRERDIYTSLKNTPHPNLVRELDVGEPYVAFFERLSLLTTVWGDADMPRRRRWAMELVSAFAHLENMGLAPRIRVEDLGTDPTGRLKLVGFGSSPRKPSAHKIVQYEADANKRGIHPSEGWQREMETAHQRLACCLHYILSGIDPDQEARAVFRTPNCKSFREKVRRGAYPIAPAASILQDILQEAWMLRAATKTFPEIAKKTRLAFENVEVEQEEDIAARLPEDHYRSLEARCREWVKTQERDSRWMGLQEYEAACQQRGFDVSGFWG